MRRSQLFCICDTRITGLIVDASLDIMKMNTSSTVVCLMNIESWLYFEAVVIFDGPPSNAISTRSQHQFQVDILLNRERIPWNKVPWNNWKMKYSGTPDCTMIFDGISLWNQSAIGIFQSRWFTKGRDFLHSLLRLSINGDLLLSEFVKALVARVVLDLSGGIGILYSLASHRVKWGWYDHVSNMKHCNSHLYTRLDSKMT